MLTLGVAGTPAVAALSDASLQSLAAGDVRLATIAYRLATANGDRCATPAMFSGLIVQELGEYRAADRAVVARGFDLHDGIGVVGVVQDSAAARAGLRTRDEIIAVDGVDVRLAAAALPVGNSYSRIEGFTGRIEAALNRGDARLTVRRGDLTQDIVLRGVAGCGGRVVLGSSQKLNAWSDGAYVVITSRLMNATVNDDELAFIVAHEMSHNNLRHQQQLGAKVSGLFASFGRTAKRIKAAEIEADEAAIQLMDVAGYQVGPAVQFLARVGRSRPLDFSTTHPGTGRRIQLVSSAIAGLSRSRPAAPAPGASRDVVAVAMAAAPQDGTRYVGRSATRVDGARPASFAIRAIDIALGGTGRSGIAPESMTWIAPSVATFEAAFFRPRLATSVDPTPEPFSGCGILRPATLGPADGAAYSLRAIRIGFCGVRQDGVPTVY